MGSVVIYPDSMVLGTLSGWAPVGSGSVFGVLADSSDSTYITDNIAGSSTYGHMVRMKLGAANLPAGAAITRVVPRVRATQASGLQGFRAIVRSIANGATTYSTPTGVYVRPDPTVNDYPAGAGGAYISPPGGRTAQAVGNDLELLIDANLDTPYTGTDDHRIYRAWVTVDYDEQPTVPSVALDPSDAVTTTSSPAITWGYADPEGVPQQGYRVVVWSATDAADANCPGAAATTFTAATGGTVRTAVSRSGTGTDPTVLGNDNRFQLPDQLLNGSYVAFVQVADKVGSTIRWSTAQGQLAFTMNVAPPAAPVLSALTWQAATARTQMTAAWAGKTGAVSALLVVERSVDGGTTWQPVPGYVDGVPIAPATSSSTTVVDGSTRHNTPVRYRARVNVFDGTWTVTSALSATVGPVTPVITGFLLRDPLDLVTAPVPVSIAGPLTLASKEAVGVFEPVGSQYAVFVSSGIVRGQIEVTANVTGEAALQALATLRARRAVLVLQTDMDGIAWWVRWGADVTETLLNSTARKAAATRPYEVKLTLHRSYGPNGQTVVP